ncbi:DNA-binding response regulator [Alteromonas sp. KUL17]|uniref:response regulator n=1 Tax=Alteromonas sp. KUL17 TaxID=2480796 RepID=UPI0010371C6F|nr:response regulator transcription factor [Alteromonas sp. KUL17]TAP24779.1 response regulator transcription factor [Alteromonas sp. KUL17]GEA03818.1 DNA-binding response regulator [Alteromonas sp. KUL17]
MNKILIVEDDANIRRMVCIALRAEGFKPLETSNVRDGLITALQQKPELIILDLGLPDGDGKEILARIRSTSSVPVLILSARNSENDKVDMLMAGANDYVSKPFSIKELIARIRVLLRDITPIIPTAERRRKIQDLTIDLDRGLMSLGDIDISLTPKELQLIDLLTREVGAFVKQQTLIRAIWGNYNSEDTHYIRILVSHVRKKISALNSNCFSIETSAGSGYRFFVSHTE